MCVPLRGRGVRPPIRIDFTVPVVRAGANIDNDGFSSERQPQLRVCGQKGSIAICDYDQGPDFRAVELSNCERILSIELGGLSLSSCLYAASDGFDNLTFDTELCGDIDGDGFLGSADIMEFVQALLFPADDLCRTNRADVNLDGSTDGRDVQPFVDCVLL
ncbi:MAG: hypothetical protein DCC65_17240 [Planctomycetota bacterium]|nr:MAG: hypothetical protein DCC65_17240 [Planctomycetota bacterium]